ncbi:MAG: DUF6268 family outer membrane beta-barrel protein [Verrucomicrobiales bacterium]|nr:DUF6268 family outer membrane beta-barrel protein [Verrucomicrobiales bacterium]
MSLQFKRLVMVSGVMLLAPLMMTQNFAANTDVSSAGPEWMKMDVVKKSPRSDISHELNWSYSYVNGSDIHRGPTSYGSLGESHMDFSYVAGIPIHRNWQLRAGLAYERYDFGSLSGSLLPNTLGAAALVLGVDVNLSEKWIMRVETRPGVYGDFKNIAEGQVNVPVIIGGTYLVSADLQFFLGAQINPHFGTGIYHWDDSPVMPGAGLRWHFADQWTLMLMLPDPEVRCDVLDNLQLYVGARIRGGSYRMGGNFGKASGRGELSNANLSYREIRAAVGARYNLMPGVTLEIEGGSAVTRQFYYSGADMQFHTDPAGYGQIQLKAQF